MPGKRWGTGTLAGQVSKSIPARLNRFFGRKSVLITLFLAAAASVTAVFTVHPSSKPEPATAAPAPAVTPPPVAPAPPVATPPIAPAPVLATAGKADRPDGPRARGTVTIQVNPVDARVVVDGRALGGTSPYVIPADMDTTLDVHVERSGYESSNQRVPVQKSEQALSVELRPSAPLPVSRNNSRSRPKATVKEAPMPAKPPTAEARRPDPPAPKTEPKKDDKEMIFAPPDEN
jgi:hypothetical protein